MDGIGGLVIGHLFQFPSELLPNGYKFDKIDENIGAKLFQTIMRLGHRIENNDWTTTIEAYNIVFNDPAGSIKFEDLIEEGVINLPPSNLEATDKQASIVSKYGEIGDKSQLTTLTFPYPMYYNGIPQPTTTVHKLVKDDLEAIFKEILSTFGLKRIKELKLDQFSGLYNIRVMRGGSAPSVHSWAIAIDLYAAGNDFKAKTGDAVFSKPEYKTFIDIWYRHNFKSFGRELGYDWMHFQVKDAPF